MPFHGFPRTEDFRTSRTGMGLLIPILVVFMMSLDVLEQTTGMAVRFIALVAGEWFLACMNRAVGVERGPISKFLVAQVAAVRSFAGMTTMCVGV
jgi:hypothetical protein